MTVPATLAPATLRRLTLAGAVAQGMVLGFLIVLAVLKLVSLAGGVSPFKYQGF